MKFDDLRARAGRISLSGANRSKTGYSAQEREMAGFAGLVVLLLTEQLESHPKQDGLPVEILTALEEVLCGDLEGKTVANVATAVYKIIEKSHRDEEDLSDDPHNWPKRRDPTSHRLLIRGGLLDLKVPKDLINSLFPKYGKRASA